MGTDKRARQKANRDRARQERIRKQKFNKVRKRGLVLGLGIPAVVAVLFGISNYVMNDSSPAASTDSTVAADGSDSQTLETLPGLQVTGATPCPKTDGTEARATIFEKAPSMCIDPAKSYTATFNTSEGVIEVALDTKKTPETVNNFVTLSRYKYYDTSFIFRTDVTLDIIQGGGSSNTDDPGYTIKDEGAGFKYAEGDLVMARSSGADSGGGQFFFVTGPKASVLDSQGTYVTFGKITKGLDVAQAILALNSGEGSLGGAPSKPVKIDTVVITEK
jgi:cyclophilin family peptidyl-prolyl cis-trans isomerase